jgi:hypothetical protein
VWLPTSSRPVSQQPSRKKPVMGLTEQTSSRSPSTLRAALGRPPPLPPLVSLSIVVSARGGRGARALRVPWLCEPHRNQPGDPEEHEIKHKKNDQADVTAEFVFHHKSDQVGGKIARYHEYDIIDDQLHNDLLAAALARK